MKGKFNIFQEIMLRWNEVNPYNAVHVARVPGELDEERLKSLIKGSLTQMGLTGYIADEKTMRFEFSGGDADISIRVIEAKTGAEAKLNYLIEQELNEPFRLGVKITPFRFFALREPEGFYLGLVYFHPISGGDSIVTILKYLVERYLGQDHPPVRFRPYQKNYRHYLSPLKVFLFQWIMRLPLLIGEVRRFHRPRYAMMLKPASGFLRFAISKEATLRLRDASKLWGVTLNDLFFSLVFKALSPLAKERHEEKRRNRLTLASIVDIRKDFRYEDLQDFGVFLSAFTVSHAVPERIPLQQLTREVCAETQKIKKEKRYLGTLIGVVLAYILLGLRPKSRRAFFFRKHFPLWGGISNMNVSPLWKETESLGVDYIRAVSTSPAYPLVFAVTGVNDVLNIGVSFNSSVFRETQVKRVIHHFLNEVNDLQGQRIECK